EDDEKLGGDRDGFVQPLRVRAHGDRKLIRPGGRQRRRTGLRISEQRTRQDGSRRRRQKPAVEERGAPITMLAVEILRRLPQGSLECALLRISAQELQPFAQ